MTEGTEAVREAESGRGAGERGRRVRGARALLLALAASAAAGSVGWACRASAGGGGMNATAASAASPGAGSPAGSAAQSQAAPLVTTLTATGFTPDRLSRAAGRFNLRVRNQSGQKEVTLRLSTAGGEKVTEVKLTEKVRDWTAPVELAAGTYTLVEAGHPEWTCRVEVTPQ